MCTRAVMANMAIWLTFKASNRLFGFLLFLLSEGVTCEDSSMTARAPIWAMPSAGTFKTAAGPFGVDEYLRAAAQARHALVHGVLLADADSQWKLSHSHVICGRVLRTSSHLGPAGGPRRNGAGQIVDGGAVGRC
mmetsp:Transcript_6916/g.22282  ORF Transcript_6916/g.22282 Transcript_6916/m.22282 type:complete len:135 (+) Transcript_6916:492-896(+)